MDYAEYIKGKRLCNLLAYAFKDIRLNDYRLMLESGYKIDLPYKQWRKQMLAELENKKQVQAKREYWHSLKVHKRRRQLVNLTFGKIMRNDFKLAKAFDKAAGKMTFKEWRDMMYKLQKEKRVNECS